MVQKHCAKTVVRATRQIVGGNYKSKLMREVQGRIGEMVREQRKGEKKDYAKNDYNQCSWFHGCYKEH